MGNSKSLLLLGFVWGTCSVQAQTTWGDLPSSPNHDEAVQALDYATQGLDRLQQDSRLAMNPSRWRAPAESGWISAQPRLGKVRWSSGALMDLQYNGYSFRSQHTAGAHWTVHHPLAQDLWLQPFLSLRATRFTPFSGPKTRERTLGVGVHLSHWGPCHEAPGLGCTLSLHLEVQRRWPDHTAQQTPSNGILVHLNRRF